MGPKGKLLDSLVNVNTVALVETVNNNYRADIHTRNSVVIILAMLTILVFVLLLNRLASFVSCVGHIQSRESKIILNKMYSVRSHPRRRIDSPSS